MMRKALALLNRAARNGQLDFDPIFYKQIYPDLHIFKTFAALRRHYLRHGKQEGRFATLAAARAHFDGINGPPPTDFDAELYGRLNPDLAKLYSYPAQLELHFLEFGRFEDRPFASAGPSEDAWRMLFNLYDFNLLNESWLPARPATRDEALAQFEAEGIDRLAPIAKGWIFDPDFYRAQYSCETKDAAALYRDWLHAGFAVGRVPNETRSIFRYFNGKPYPIGFDWRRYCKGKRIEATPPYPAKINALELFFESPLDAFAQSCVSENGAARFYEAVGNYNLIRARFTEGAAAFKLASASEGTVGRLHLKLGDALKALGEYDEALSAYRQALTMQDCSIWALVHSVNIMLTMKMFREAMRLVELESDRFRGHDLFDGFTDEVASIVYRSVSDTMHALISDDQQDAVLDTYAAGRLGEITAFLRKTKIAGGLSLAAKGPRRVVILACLDLAQCTFYRVEQKRRLLEDSGIDVEVFDFNDPALFMSALPGAVAAIFYRVPSYPKIVESILYASSLGIQTYFDIDDLVFTRDFPDSFESYEHQISRQEYFGLCHGVALYRHAISLCDGAIVSTQPLADRIAPLVAGGTGRTFVVPNGLDDRSETPQRYGACRPDTGDDVAIFYGSGTKAHNRDFTDIVAPALLELFASHPQCRLVIVGYLRLDKRFDAYADRIERFSFIGDLNAYWAILASCDINISVLHVGPLADCKSEIKWLEAAMLGVPSIVSATRAFAEVLTEGSTGFLARDSADWRRHLRSLIESKDLRKAIGAQARDLALREYGAPAVTAKLEAALFERADARPRDNRIAHRSRKPRLLICNVFFAPQSHGGATRVVEDNVAQLLDRYSDEFDISILSTFKGLKAGALRVDTHRGVPVYRIGTPVEVNMDWRPFNDEDVLPAFRRVLEVAEPDLVHFHCIQRLGASIVEETLRADIPYVVTAHDAWWISDHQFLVDQNDGLVDLGKPFQTLLPAGVSRTDSLERMQRLKSLLNAGAATLAVSRSFAELYRKAGISNVTACENGIGALRPPLPKTTPADKIVLGHIGGRSVHKGAALVELVLKSHAFENLTLLMIDGTLDTGEENRELWGSTQVTLRAPVSVTDIDRLYSQIDVLLAPSIWPESFGLVAREAIFYETWVVASSLGAIAQDVQEGSQGFVIDTSRSEDLVSALSRIDGEVETYKGRPEAAHMRRSSVQLDEIVVKYREILQARATRTRTPTVTSNRSRREYVSA